MEMTRHDKHLLANAGVLQQVDLKDPHTLLIMWAWSIHGCCALWACVVLKVITEL